MRRLVYLRRRALLLACLSSIMGCSEFEPRSGSAIQYALTDLTSVLGDSLQPAKMNGAGQFLALRIVNSQVARIYLWDSGRLQHLPCDGAYSYDLNDRGQVLCGTSVWDAGSLRPLDLPDTAAQPYALSDSGVVGGIERGCAASSIGVCVFAYRDKQMKLAPINNLCCGFAVGVQGIADATGDILYGYYDGIESRSFLLSPSTGAVTPVYTGASNINAAGHMAGTAAPNPNTKTNFPAFVWYFNGDSTASLGTGSETWINDRGDILAWMDSQPMLLRGGTRVSLLHPVPGTTWTVKRLYMIDDAGRILAAATRDTAYHTVLLTPTVRGATIPLLP